MYRRGAPTAGHAHDRQIEAGTSSSGPAQKSSSGLLGERDVVASRGREGGAPAADRGRGRRL